MPAGFDGLPARSDLQTDIGIGLKEILRELDDPALRGVDLKMGENAAGDEFIDEYSAMLRVILKLDDVEIAVVGFQQMGLRAAPHLSDEPGRIYGHRESWEMNWQSEANSEGSIN